MFSPSWDSKQSDGGERGGERSSDRVEQHAGRYIVGVHPHTVFRTNFEGFVS